MDKNTNAINWFDIPATDLPRAKKFYETVFNVQMEDYPAMAGMEMIGFPSEMGNGKVSGSLTKSPMHKPSADGAVIYLNANPEIQTVVDRIEKAGGKVLMPKTQINPEVGYMAFFIDSEGNKIGLHGQN